MQTKNFGRVEIKDADKGEVAAVFSTFDVIDSDGDVTSAGAFEDGTVVPISSYGHGSWSGALPVGKGRIRQTATEAILDGQFFMDTTAGRDTFTTVKELGELGQWSYGYDPVEFHFGEVDDRKVRFLDRLKVHEVSPVLVGAGVNTRTLSAKSQKETPMAEPTGYKAIRPHSTEITARAWDAAAVVDALPDTATVDDLRSMFAWCDGDPTAKGSYRFAHHHGIDGPANVRAVVAAIAVLNGAKGTTVPDGDREAVYEHLATHLRDADRDVPELRPTGGELKLNDEAAVILVGIDDFLASASRVVALRASKGKTLSHVNTEILEWIDDDLRRLRSLLDTPGDDMARQLARFEQARFASLRAAS